MKTKASNIRYVLFVFVLTFYLPACQQKKVEQPKQGILHFSEVGWTIDLSKESEFLTSEQIDSMQKAAINKFTKANDINLNTLPIETLFTLKSGLNGFSATIEKYDSQKYPDWQLLHDIDKQNILDAIKTQKINFNITDSSSAQENIDGLPFLLFYFKLYYPHTKMTMHNYWFTRKTGAYNFTVNINFIDEKMGKKYLDLFRNSKFNFR